jgi:hypothetical protein
LHHTGRTLGHGFETGPSASSKDRHDRAIQRTGHVKRSGIVPEIEPALPQERRQHGNLAILSHPHNRISAV